MSAISPGKQTSFLQRSLFAIADLAVLLAAFNLHGQYHAKQRAKGLRIVLCHQIADQTVTIRQNSEFVADQLGSLQDRFPKHNRDLVLRALLSAWCN